MFLKKLLSAISANSYLQRLLQRNVQISQYLMGIGSGSDVLYSGEQSIVKVLESRAQSPYCIFDVGSNRGQFLKMVIGSISKPGWSIHCFEPGAETIKSLEAYVKTLKVSGKIFLNNVALGEERGESILYFDRAGSALASLTKRKLDHLGIDFEGFEKVKLNTVDDYCIENSIGRIDLLKIDVEGHELQVLLGAKKMFESRSIDMVTFEFGGTNIDTKSFFRDYWYFFEWAHMQIFRITPSGYLSPINSYNVTEEQFVPTNFIATLRGAEDSRSR